MEKSVRDTEEPKKLNCEEILKRAGVGVLYLDTKLKIRRLTEVMCEHTGLQMTDLGKNLSECTFLEGYAHFEEDVQHTLEKRINKETEVYQNDRIWMVRIRPYVTDADLVEGVLVILFDITNRLEEAKHELELLDDSVPGGIARMRYDNGLILEYGNDTFCRMIHMTREEIAAAKPLHCEQFLKKADWECLQEKIRDGIKTGELISVEYEVTNSKRLSEWHLLQGLVLEQGETPMLQCVILDVTEQKNTENMLDSLLQNMAGGIMRVYFDGTKAEIVYLSDACYKMLGYTKEQYEKLRGEDEEHNFYIFKEYEAQLIEKARRAMAEEDMEPAEYRLIKEDGSEMWMNLYSEVVSRGKSGILIQYVMIDNTVAHENYLKMYIEKRKLEIIVEIAADLLFEYDVKNDSMFYTKQRADGLVADQIASNYLKVIQSEGWIHPDDSAELKDFCDQMRGGKKLVHTQLRKRFTDRKYHWVEVDGRTIYDDKGYPEKVIGKITNIDDRKAKEEQLKLNSERDSLTGLYNHMVCMDKVRRQLRTLKQGDEAALIICDIDNFKQVNDQNGHLFGDAVLCSFADELRTLFPSSVKGRIGGDEFMVFAKNMNPALVEAKLYQLNTRFSKLNTEDADRMRISCSIGVAICTYEKHDYESAFRCADYELYKVKNSSKGNFLMAKVGDEEIGQHQSYLDEENDTGKYVREEALIQNDEELVLFALELLDNVADSRSGLKMVSDRICRYFGFDDILYVNCKGTDCEALFHWGNDSTDPFKNLVLANPEEGIQYIKGKFDEQDVATLGSEEIRQLFGQKLGSILMVRYKEENSTGVVIFADQLVNRSWENVRTTLLRLSNIYYNRILQLQHEEKIREEVEQRVNYDSLTGLPNYSKFLTLCEKYLQEIPERERKEYCFAYADFSNFQYLNEIYGYSAGDAVLQGFGENLKKSPIGIFFSRITSDHFVGMLHWRNGENIQEMKDYLTGFCQMVRNKYPLCTLNLICGISPVTEEKLSVSTQVDYANIARKYGKGAAETSVIVYNDDIRRQGENEMSITANMYSALENHEFQVYLQPKVSLKNGRSEGAEALVRWIRPDGSMVYPDQFIPVFEKNGFVTKLDFYVLEEVLKYMREALDKGEEVVPVSVNFSRVHNNDDLFVERIAELLKKYEIRPELLEAEVTESVYMYDMKSLREKLSRLHEMGVLISIDDFGSGYSSLNVLSQMFADIVKLDRQFLMGEGIENSPEFIKYLITMIKHLGYRIIAEGVETEEQIDMLKNADCDMVQGYFYAKPMPIEAFRDYLKEFNKK